jgi:tetratricopeptide (TPR) repeat protein
MSYSGNPSLAPDVRRRILSTFRQTLDLAARGSHHEATLGCDFILQMDPHFGPARALQERLNGAPGQPVEVDDLRAGVAALEDAAGPPEVEAHAGGGAMFGDLDDLDLEVDAGTPAADDPALRDRLADRLEVRDFAGALELARRSPQAIAADAELARLVETATARQEAAPYVQKFLDAARRSLGDGDERGAATMLEKARSLDPTHPGLRDLATRLAAGPAPPPRRERPPAPPAAARAEPPDSESAGRIAELLAEGQKSFGAGDYQSAIDAWSRIFLIDIDHAEASRRIEEARRLKAEQERRIEEVFHEASDSLESGDRAAARRGFERVIELEPGHLAAREYLERLSRDEAPRPAAAPAAPRPAPAAGGGTDPFVLKEEILVPPPPGAAVGRDADRPRTGAGKEGGARRRFVLIGSGVLALAVAALFVAYQNRDRLFPNSSEAAPPTAETVDPIARATRLHDDGKTAMAINQLRRLPPSDPHYEEAQALISQWEASGRAPDGAATSAPAPEALERRRELLAAAADSLSRRQFLTAEESFAQAASIAPLDDADAELRRRAERALEPLAREIQFFREGEYELALPGLWRLHQAEPDNPDVRRLIVDSYYNMAVRDLQRGDARGAAGKLDEAAGLVPDDAEIARHRLFAQAYQEREKDLQYRIYVKYLPRR